MYIITFSPHYQLTMRKKDKEEEKEEEEEEEQIEGINIERDYLH